ncbi:MAG: hypothetical protein L6V90_07285 [Treponema succinifaciens]|nr:MAG: hypothetical protein L6V90_07285 [Treponema succinifaciens]
MKNYFFKNIVALALFSVAFAGVFSESPYNKNLSAEDIESLSSGKTVIKNTGSYKKMCMKGENPGLKKVVETVSNLKPAYFAEVIKEYTYEGNENLLDNFSSLVMDSVLCRNSLLFRKSRRMVRLVYFRGNKVSAERWKYSDCKCRF